MRLWGNILATTVALSLCRYPSIAVSSEDIPAGTPIASLVSSAQYHLSRGEIHEALAYYDAAVGRDPSDYLTLFKRATAYLSLGRLSLATDDFNSALELEPRFQGAHVQLAKLKSRGADWEGARHHFQLAHKTYDSAELTSLEEAHNAAILAETAQKRGEWGDCVSHTSAALKVANRATSLLSLRARCQFEAGQVEGAMLDLQHVLQLRPGDTAPYVNISATALYALADIPAAMSQTRKCLQSDPDSKQCRQLLMREKAIDKAISKAEGAIVRKTPITGIKVLVGTTDEPGLIDEVRQDMKNLLDSGVLRGNTPKGLYLRLIQLTCQGYYEAQNEQAQSFCEEVLQLDPRSLYGLLHQARILMDRDSIEAAITSYRKALDTHHDQEGLIRPLLEEAQIALKRHRTKNYYKILDVNREADDRQIKSAYRKLSKKYHPDKAVAHGITKVDAEKKMAQLNEAYEVLSDPELRARFDNGDDPNSHGGSATFNRFNDFSGPGSPIVFPQGAFKFTPGSRGGGFPRGFAFG